MPSPPAIVLKEKRNDIVMCCVLRSQDGGGMETADRTKGEQLLSVNFTISNSSESQLGRRLVGPAAPKEEGS